MDLAIAPLRDLVITDLNFIPSSIVRAPIEANNF